MTDDLFPRPRRPLDALVRARLEQQARSVDWAPLLDRARGRGRYPTRRRWLVALPAVVAACLVVGFFALAPGGRVQASPARVVERAHQVHTRPVDRLYRLRTELAPEIRARFPRLDGAHEVDLWTRGDRFRIGLGDQGSWGRDEHGRIWLAPTPTAGALFEPDEVPPVLAEFLAVRSVDLPALLDQVLHHCDLRRSSGSSATIDRIEAIPGRGASPWLVRATLDIDRVTLAVQRLEVHRKVLPGATVRITITYQESRPQADARYRLAGQLSPGAEVFDRSRPGPRLGLLLRQVSGGRKSSAGDR